MNVAANHYASEHPGQKQNHNYLTKVLESNSSWATVSVVANHPPR